MADAPTSDPTYKRTQEELLAAEAKYFEGDPRPRWGLALSGGGIRSASFALGVLQRLVAGQVLKSIRYLSTVSGGGYIGSSLTWFLHDGLPDGSPAGTEPKNFPFSEGGTTGPARPVVGFIRDHCSYLVPGRGLGGFSLFGVVVRGIFVSFFVYLAMTIAIMEVLTWAGAFRPLGGGSAFVLGPVRIPQPGPLTLNVLLLAAVAVVLLLLVASLWFSIRTQAYSSESPDRYRSLIRGQRLIGRAWKAVAILLVVGLIPVVSELIQSRVTSVATGSAMTGLGALTGLYEFWKQMAPGSGTRPWLSKLRIVVGGAALVFGFLLLGYALSGLAPLFVPALLASVIFGLIVNLNYVGFHRMYRNRLMEAFMPNSRNVRDNRWGAATEADRQRLEDVCADRDKGPYHLINTNLVLVASEDRKYEGRGGDSFILSPLFCGSEATGWRQTDHYMSSLLYLAGKRRLKARGLTLPTAMAISGAAVNPNTGGAGTGPTRNPLVSFLMTVLNLRLGYWASNPDRLPRYSIPNFISPGLRSLFGYGFDERRRTIELTDGGHFENLGLYELIRRGLDLIIVCDAGQDKDFQFTDLANALERVRVDHGVEVVFMDEEYSVNGLIPGSGRPELDLRLAKRGYAIGQIIYPQPDEDSTEPPPTGVLVYIKTTLSEGLTADIYGYRKTHKDFPDQTTADQFFDEAQFEAYRQLGFETTGQLLRDNEGMSKPWIPILAALSLASGHLGAGQPGG